MRCQGRVLLVTDRGSWKEVRYALFDRVINPACTTGEGAGDNLPFILLDDSQYQVAFTDRAAQDGEEIPFHR